MSSFSRTLLSAGLLTALLSITGDAQQPNGTSPSPAADGQADAQPPVFRAGINFVRVDVIVTDKSGNPVSNLQARDFEVSEDGKAQEVQTFKLVELDGGRAPGPDGPPRAIRSDGDEESEAARDDVRLFGVFLDDYHVRRETSIAARQRLAQFVEAELGPSDMIGLMYPLEPGASVRFTRNHDAVMGSLQGFLGRKYDYTPANDIEERYAHYPTETVERIRNQVSMSAIQGLIARMGSLKEGRKALILVSEGYSNMVPPQLRSPIAGEPDPNNPAYGDPNAGLNSPLEERAAFIAGADLALELREIYAAANRNNVAIYPVDPRGLGPEFGLDQNLSMALDQKYLESTRDTLRTLAVETDGRAIVSRNDLAVAMKQIVRDSSAYYLLGYTSTAGNADGRFHEIKVRVRRPGVQIRARKGYWAISAEAAARATAPAAPGLPKEVEAALAAIVPTRARLVRTWIGAERGENGRNKVTFLWEPVARPPGDRRGSTEEPAVVALTAAGSDGVPYYRGRTSLPPATPVRPSPSGSLVTFEAQPGRLQLRMSVESIDSHVLDTETQDITLPDLTAPRPQLGTPAVFRARTVREFQQLHGDPQAIPTAAREFNRTERLFVRVAAYGAGGSIPVVTARLLNRGGQSMFALQVAAERDAQPSIDLPIANLAPAEYLLEIKAAGEGGEATELVGFRITG